MIQIKIPNLEAICQIHYDALHPFLQERLKLHNGVLEKFILSNLKKILIGKPKELEEVIAQIESLRIETKSISDIFNYKKFTNSYSEKKYNAYSLAENLNVKVCPYCNRQYTFTIHGGKNRQGKTRPQFDHFYSKYKYPYLALSFFNLIPCCGICNSSFKNTKEFSLEHYIHPYSEGFEDDVKFRIELKDKSRFKKSEVKKWYGVNFFNGSLKSFEIKLLIDNPSTSKEKRANKNIETFHLENLYNQHKDYVVEIVQKAEIYSADYISSIFAEFEGKLFNSEKEIYQMILSNYITSEDFDKRVLSKLTRDISEELGMGVS